MRRSRFGSDLKRRGPFRDPTPRLLVVCEGTATEPDYVNGFLRAFGAVTVRVKVVSPGGDPLALVREAVRLREEADDRASRLQDENARYDEVWCVFDIDDHARLESARQSAHDGRVQVAVSNPCFELWLLLHFTDQSSAVSRRALSTLLRKHVPNYGKHVRFQAMADGYLAAVRRAAELDTRHVRNGTPGANPSTGVFRLTERIRELGKDRRLSGG